MTEQEPIKIVIPVEEEEPLKVERPSATMKETAGDAGRKVVDAAKETAQKAWESDARRKATEKLSEVADKGVRYVGTRVADAAEEQTRQKATAVQERIKETDWSQEAKKGLAKGLQWASAQLAELAGRVNRRQEKSPPEEPPADPTSKM